MQEYIKKRIKTIYNNFIIWSRAGAEGPVWPSIAWAIPWAGPLIEQRLGFVTAFCTAALPATRTAARSAAGRSCRCSSLQASSRSEPRTRHAPAARSGAPLICLSGCLVPPAAGCRLLAAWSRRGADPHGRTPAACRCFLLGRTSACLVVCLAACLMLSASSCLLASCFYASSCLIVTCEQSIERSKVAHEYLFDYAREYFIMRV